MEGEAKAYVAPHKVFPFVVTLNVILIKLTDRPRRFFFYNKRQITRLITMKIKIEMYTEEKEMKNNKCLALVKTRSR